MKLTDLVPQLERSLAAKAAEMSDAREAAEAYRKAAETERRAYRDDPKWQAARKLERTLGIEAAQLEGRLEEAQTELERDEAAGRLASAFHAGAAGGTERTFTSSTTTRSRDTYDAESDRTGRRSFFADLYNAQRGDIDANQRMNAFQNDRATSTGSFAGLVVPQYLVDQAALLARAGRPFADSVTKLQIPEQGQSLLVPRGTTGASVAVQATENTAVSSTDEVWANVTLPVATVAGQQDVSRQSLERGDPGLDSLVFADLAGAYAVALDAQTLSGTGASGQVLGVLNTAGISQATAFTAAATVGAFYTKVAGQISAISSARFSSPTHIAMHPRRYAWLVAQVDSQGRPLVLPSAQGPMNAMGNLGGEHAYGVGPGTFQGLQIVVDANLPTAVGTGPEDQVLVYRAADILLWEDGDGSPKGLRFEQTLGNQLTVKLVSYGYLAFTAGRYPAAVGVVGGNAAAGFGLVAPTF